MVLVFTVFKTRETEATRLISLTVPEEGEGQGEDNVRSKLHSYLTHLQNTAGSPFLNTLLQNFAAVGLLCSILYTLVAPSSSPVAPPVERGGYHRWANVLYCY